MSLTSFSNISIEAKVIRFLDPSSVVVGGNSPAFNVQVLDLVNASEQNSEPHFINKAEYAIPGNRFEHFALCSLYYRPYIAASSTDRAGVGSIRLLSLPSMDSTISEQLQLESPSNSRSECPIFTSVAFCSPGILSSDSVVAAATETGDVVVWDFNVNKIIANFHVDSVGVNSILFSSSGCLCAAGCTSRAQLKLWDIRSSLSFSAITTSVGSSLKPIVQYSHSKSSSGSSGRFPSYTALCNHPSLPKIFCGTDEGQIVEWDLRDSGSQSLPSQVTSAHRGAVTDLAVHPGKYDCIYSSSQDGTVAFSNINSSLTSQQSLQNSIVMNPSEHIILSEPAAITSIDTLAPNMLLATSSLGGVWQFGL